MISGMMILQLFLKKGLVVDNASWGQAFQIIVLECLGGVLLILANFWWPVWLVLTAWVLLGMWLLDRVYNLGKGQAFLIAFVHQLLWGLVIVVLAMAWKEEVGQLWRIQGELMCPTINVTHDVCTPENPDVVWVNRRQEHFQRGDVVAFRVPGTDAVDVARVIGVGGDRLAFQAGKVLEIIDGEALEIYEPYLPDAQKNQTFSPISHIEIKEGYYFLMRDQRTESVDSRLCFSQVGCSQKNAQATIPESQIIGKVELVLWPGVTRKVY